MDDDLKRQRAGRGAPIQNIKDYGLEVGGPIPKRGRAVVLGQLRPARTSRPASSASIFPLPDARCQAMKSWARRRSFCALPTTDEVRGCLGDRTGHQAEQLQREGRRGAVHATTASRSRTAGERSSRMRATRPTRVRFEMRCIVRGLAPSRFGAFGWLTGPNPMWKAERPARAHRSVARGRAVVARRQQLRARFPRGRAPRACSPATRLRQLRLRPLYLRAGPFIRPTNSVDVMTSYFMPGHARPAITHSRPAIAGARPPRTPRSTSATPSPRFTDRAGGRAGPKRLAVPRVGHRLPPRNAGRVYVQDTFQAGQPDAQSRRSLGPAARILVGLAPCPRTRSRRRFCRKVTFHGADPGVVWDVFSPRLGANWDFQNDGRTVAHALYARCTLGRWRRARSLAFSTRSAAVLEVDFPWVDTNGNRTVEARVKWTSSQILFFSGNWGDPASGPHVRRHGQHPSIPTSRTIARASSSSASIASSTPQHIAVGASYIWRNYDPLPVGRSPELHERRTTPRVPSSRRLRPRVPWPTRAARRSPTHEPTIPIGRAPAHEHSGSRSAPTAASS